MYPNLYYAIKDLFGLEIAGLKIFNSFGLFLALAFICATLIISKEFKRKEHQGFILPWKETKIIGEAAPFIELLVFGLIGFLFGYKLSGAFIDAINGSKDLQEYALSIKGNWIGGIAVGIALIYLTYSEKNKKKLAVPEKKIINVWPHQKLHVAVIFAFVFGILGAKIFDILENWGRFIKDPIGNILSPNGLTFYGALIFATIAIAIYGVRKGVHFWHGADCFAPAIMIAYAIGRLGCHVSGDGDWGIYNSAYTADFPGHVVLAKEGDFQRKIQTTCILNNSSMSAIKPGSGISIPVGHCYVKAPRFLPNWLFAYTYPHNFIEEGIPIPGCDGEFCKVLPQPVLPSSLYEAFICTFLFFILWGIRKSIKIPGYLTAVYLIFNGGERFLIESIRVNTVYSFWGIHPTQAQIISILVFLTGILLLMILKILDKREQLFF